jgi:hypothetical protein
MIDCRSPKYRRKGECDGRFSWGVVVDAFVLIIISLAIFAVGFWTGTHYAKVSIQDIVNPATIFSQYKSSRVHGH